MFRICQLPWGLTAAILATTWLPLQSVAAPSVNIALKAAFPAPPYLVELLYSFLLPLNWFGRMLTYVMQRNGSP
jgi:hypothetical protein